MKENMGLITLCYWLFDIFRYRPILKVALSFPIN